MTVKCSICGKFISLKDMEDGLVESEFTPDSDYSIEHMAHYHKKCGIKETPKCVK